LLNDFEQGNTDTFNVKAVNLGEIEAVELSKTGSDDWRVDQSLK